MEITIINFILFLVNAFLFGTIAERIIQARANRKVLHTLDKHLHEPFKDRRLKEDIKITKV